MPSAHEFGRESLRRGVASVCRTIGWQSLHASAMDALVHVFETRLLQLATRAHRHAEHRRRTTPTLADLAAAFADCDVRALDLQEYVDCVPPSPAPLDPPPFPLERPPNLHFLKPGSREVLTRPVHVHEHLPPTRPDDPDEPPKDVFKRPADPEPPPSSSSIKRIRLSQLDDETRARELSSVMMTTSGFLSPAREGRLPEARTPPDAPKPRPEKAKHPKPTPVLTPPPPPPPQKKRDRKRPGSTFRPDSLPPPPLPPPPPQPQPIAIKPPSPPVVVKEEKFDDEKLTSQPDPSKLNIFKKISAKPKEDHRTPEPHQPVPPPPVVAPKPVPPAPVLLPKPERRSPERVDVTKMPLFGGADPFPIKIKEEPPDDYPKDDDMDIEPLPSPPRLPPQIPHPQISHHHLYESVKKDKKLRKEKRSKEEKLARALEKQKRVVLERPPPPPPFQLFNSSPGLIPNGGLLPGLNPALLNSLYENPALRCLLRPDDSVNSFSAAHPYPMPGDQRRPVPKRSPNLPAFLRRPSLEVIPIEDEPHLDVVSSPPRGTPMFSAPSIRPDVTIELNPPRMDVVQEVRTAEPSTDRPVLNEPEREKSEKKKDKIHKKDKKDKEQKFKKKKDKKEKSKMKLEKKKEKEERQELKDRLKKEKKEKRREREKAAAAAAAAEGIVPKLTLKLNPSSPMLPASPEPAKKLIIKPVVKREEFSDGPADDFTHERSDSPELARISALVTRPPKPKSSNKHSFVPNMSDVVGDSPPRRSSSPPRKNKPSLSSSSFAKYKRINYKQISKRGGSDFDDPIVDLGVDDHIDEPEPIPPPPAVVPVKVPSYPPGSHSYEDPQGNTVWICPECRTPDNGTPMIGCDGCDAWYHWVCVGIVVDPGDTGDWYCDSCIAKKTANTVAASGSAKKRGRKPKMDKIREIR